ncbi:chromosome segregation protein SMC [Bifidobacterium sp. DSM 109958]|uniref:Chromosome partition protein Smc n=1 Tax=Bifidobacterium moraviense TaxID=2675323 RepID=A0A7Y0HZQ3_9BIFI|nr:chromosome segregation protein SMC [Bifidobacterium sp. DSM 109958]
MYLKELTLRGFKSFASATTLRFEPGITAVVGPNGSGKSNIVDALAWVMGEQGAKALRGTQMEDVIFAGTSSRPPLGRAQVTLTIDNADRALDIDYTEVTISRTIFRNGGSEYAINGSPCRLLDIQELLSDTGLGQQMHVIVGQGRLDAILRADPSGHRAFIEEAAGILKHRRRKERALRKLANTEQNLARLDDLLGEIRRRLGPLGRQARISRRAEAIRATLRDAQARLYADDALAAMTARDRTRAELGEVRAALAHAHGELARVRTRIEQVETLAGSASPAIARANETWHRVAQLQERYRSLAQLARERGRSFAGQIVAQPAEDPELLSRRADELAAQAAARHADVDDARLALDQATERRAACEQRLASVRQTLGELRRTARQREARLTQLNTLITREESAVELARTRRRDFAAQRDALALRRGDAEERRLRAERDAETSGGDDDAALDQARAGLASRAETLDALTDRQRELNGRIIALTAKADALADALDGRAASGELAQDHGIGVMGRLADFIAVRDGWEEAVARALDAVAGALVVPDTDAMLRALDRARTDRLGRAVVLSAGTRSDDGSGGDGDAGSSGDSAADGAWPCAATLVDANAAAPDADAARRVVTAVRSLLGDVAAAADLADARAAIEAGWSRAVTRGGELLTPVSACGGSTLSQSDLSLSARRDKALRQADALRGELTALDAQVAAATEARDRARLAVDHAVQRRAERRLRAQQAVRALAEARRHADDLDRQLHGLDAGIADVERDERLHAAKLDDLRTALEAARDVRHGDGDADELDARERALEADLGTARDAEAAARIAWTDASRKADSLDRQTELLRDQAGQAEQRRTRIAALNARRREQAAQAARIADDADAIARMADRYLAQAAERRDALQAQAAEHDGELKRLRAERDRIDPQAAEFTAREHALDVDRERIAGQLGRIAQRIADDLGTDMDELVARYGPDVPVPVLDEQGRPVPQDGADANAAATAETAADTPDAAGAADAAVRPRTVPYVREEQQRRLDKAQRDLKALGKVNPLATEEFDALEARHQYLKDQRDDVARSRDDLMGLIRDLDATMVSVFSDAFADTAQEFERMFAMLFPGGRGRLRLENPDDPLASGVIVEASPAGKRVRQLSLLSGGERSLTALALLFAIFTARPSPFYVMDEVEAALDDVNLTRLLDAFETLREHAQLIVITHQQRTMSIADALYGVTMRADGVTAVISQRLDRSSDR